MVFDVNQLASKLLDDELDSKKDMDNLLAQPEGANTFARYQLIGDLMRDEPLLPDMDISAGVSAAIAAEPTILAPQTNHSQPELKSPAENVVAWPSRVSKPLGGFAIAASVALVALFAPNTVEQNANSIEAMQLVDTKVNGTANTNNLSASQRAELVQFQQVLTELPNGGAPVIQTVTNQKVVAVTVPVNSATSSDLENKKDTENKVEDSEQE